MPPATRKARSQRPDPELEEEEATTGEDTATVRRLSTVHLDLDAEVAADEGEQDPDPFTFTLGGQDWSVPRPGVGQTLDAEQAPFLSDFFETVMGQELWEEFEPVFREQRNPDLTWKLARGMSMHFGMDPSSMQDKVEKLDKAEGNRAQRRGRGRVPPRRR